MKHRPCRWPLVWLVLGACCSRPEPADGGTTGLKAATDVFWALNERGYVITKEKPSPSVHGCRPAEFLAAFGETTFRISVFECQNEEKAGSIVDHPHTRHVDSLLRNRGEGGILRRGTLEIIVRFLSGDKTQVPRLLELLETL